MKKNIDYPLALVTFFLVAFGTTMVFSASSGLGLSVGDPFYFVKRHLLYLLVGAGALFFAFKANLEHWKKWSWLIFLLSVFGLLLVYVPHVGIKISGAKRWINFGVLTVQPSEIAKFTLILFLATILSNKKVDLKDFWRWFFPLLLMVLVVAGLIFLEPDLGTSIVFIAVALAMFFLAGAQLLHLSGLLVLGFIGVIAVSLKSAYRLRRFLAYFDPWQDPQGVGFHIIQSLLAVGSGGIFGLGLGQSKQKFFYLPQQTTDFIYAILCEELGFLGGVSILILFLIFAWRGIVIASQAPNRFYSLFAGGITFWIVLQAFLNIGVVTGLLPTTGMPLPFISYGGTSVVMFLFAVGILLNISIQGSQR